MKASAPNRLPGTIFPVELRTPTLSDGAALWRLARDSKVLDLNSPYSYLLLADHHGHTSVIAEQQGEPVGFVTAWTPPRKPDVLFVWQVTTSEAVRGQGVAGRMLDFLLTLPAHAAARYLETTVTPSNGPSRALFHAFARRHGATVVESDGYTSDHFPPEGTHEAERLLRIGPLQRGTGPNLLNGENSDDG